MLICPLYNRRWRLQSRPNVRRLSSNHFSERLLPLHKVIGLISILIERHRIIILSHGDLRSIITSHVQVRHGRHVLRNGNNVAVFRSELRCQLADLRRSHVHWRFIQIFCHVPFEGAIIAPIKRTIVASIKGALIIYKGDIVRIHVGQGWL